eukprot:m.26761 g.26761  ORF g.26761 m.26761 type:complete len:267 (-) comp4345_c0_seq1:172-972(-)
MWASVGQSRALVTLVALLGSVATSQTTASTIRRPPMHTTIMVSGYARAFATSSRISGAVLTATGPPGVPTVVTSTNSTGQFEFQWPVGAELLGVRLNTEGYHPTSGGAFHMGPSGMSGRYGEYTFQVPKTATYIFLKTVLPGKVNESACHFVVTVTPANTTLDSSPQGEPGAVATLLSPGGSPTAIPPYYFGIFKDNKTNPFARGLNTTSRDGGVVFLNVAPHPEPYTIVVTKPGKTFTNASLFCQPGQSGLLVNVAPPLGPHVIE